MIRMWMVRAERGQLYDAFHRHGVVAMNWTRLAPVALQAESREALIATYAVLDPARRQSALVSGASQVWRFVHEIALGDWAVTYAPQRRMYRVGPITGPASYRPELSEQGLPLVRPVDWCEAEVPRDALPPTTRNRLGPTLTLFRVAPGAARQLIARAAVSG